MRGNSVQTVRRTAVNPVTKKAMEETEMKKILTLMLAAVMVMALTACGNDSSKPASGNNSGTEQKTESKTEQETDYTTEKQNETEDDYSTSGSNDEGENKGWPAEQIAAMAASVNATIPELKAENVTYEQLFDSTLYIYSTHIEKDDCTAWMASLAEQGFVRSLGLVGNSAFKVDGNKKFSVSVMGADESYIVTVSAEELEATEWPYYQLQTAFGENFGVAIFNANGLFAGLSKEYSWSYDPETFTVTCNEAEDELETYVRDLALSSHDYFDEANGKYVKYMFFLAIDESQTEGKQMECYINRDGSTLTVRFALADHAE